MNQRLAACIRKAGRMKLDRLLALAGNFTPEPGPAEGMNPMRGTMGTGHGLTKRKMAVCPAKMVAGHRDRELVKLGRLQAKEAHALQHTLNMERYGKHVRCCQTRPAPFGRWA